MTPSKKEAEILEMNAQAVLESIENGDQQHFYQFMMAVENLRNFKNGHVVAEDIIEGSEKLSKPSDVRPKARSIMTKMTDSEAYKFNQAVNDFFKAIDSRNQKGVEEFMALLEKYSKRWQILGVTRAMLQDSLKEMYRYFSNGQFKQHALGLAKGIFQYGSAALYALSLGAHPFKALGRFIRNCWDAANIRYEDFQVNRNEKNKKYLQAEFLELGTLIGNKEEAIVVVTENLDNALKDKNTNLINSLKKELSVLEAAYANLKTQYLKTGVAYTLAKYNVLDGQCRIAQLEIDRLSRDHARELVSPAAQAVEQVENLRQKEANLSSEQEKLQQQKTKKKIMSEKYNEKMAKLEQEKSKVTEQYSQASERSTELYGKKEAAGLSIYSKEEELGRLKQERDQIGEQFNNFQENLGYYTNGVEKAKSHGEPHYAHVDFKKTKEHLSRYRHDLEKSKDAPVKNEAEQRVHKGQMFKRK